MRVCNFFIRLLICFTLCLPAQVLAREYINLTEMDQNQVLIICSPGAEIPDAQLLTLSAVNLPAVRRRLENSGIRPGPWSEDPVSGRRTMSFSGPDHTRIEIIEAD